MLDNANKYSPNNPIVKISTLNADDGVEIQIADNGIGIAAEYHSEIFRKFFRVPNGNRHDVKGYGLGLYYVYTMINAHGGQIGFISEPGSGTTFDLHFLYNGPDDLNQEPEDEAGIKNFCELNYGVTFPMFSKIDVNGDNAHDLFKYLRQETKGLLGDSVKWNFTKFLVGKDGKVIRRYAPQTDPMDIEKDIKELL